MRALIVGLDEAFSRFEISAKNLMKVGSDDEARCEISDEAVNVLRKEFGKDASLLLKQELSRMKKAKIKLDGSGLIPYLRLRRPGSKFRLSRKLREKVYAQIVCRLAR